MKIILLALLFLGSLAQAQTSCTDWTQARGVSCIFAGHSADLWKRQCLNPCRYQSGSSQCQNESICLDRNLDPNRLSSNCTDWSAESGVTCQNVNTEQWEQRWVRACQGGYSTEQWCSNQRPPFN